jgi:eukaryotic-like serine/threonine-protein kinase
LIGQTISNFKILAKIAENATGTLYRAIDTESDRLVTLRVLSQSAAANPEIRTQLERARGLQHPNIARMDGYVRWEDIHFAVMEAPEGESVYDFLERERPKRRHLLRFTQQIASALEAANGCGIVHGPLDPAAIFVTAPGQIRIYDLGFGVLDPPPESEQERLISFGKSAPYVSPEQLEGSRPDVRSDIFSFGALLYHMTTGHLPFRGATVSEIWNAIREREPKPAAEITSRVPQGMDKLLERCLRKKPESRFQQFGEIQPAIEKMVTTYRQNPRRVITGNRGRIAKIAGIAVAAAAAVAAAFFGWSTRSNEEPVTGKSPLQITSNAGYDCGPVFSSDGTQLAYASDRNGGGYLHIWTQSANGGEIRQLTTGPDDDQEPAFAPDSATIAFRSERNGGGIYLVSTKGGDPRLLATGGRRPRYSPDGRWVAYWTGPSSSGTQPDAAYKMFIVRSGGGAPRPVRPDIAPAAYPTWSPDGKSLLFLGQGNAFGGAGATEWFVTSAEGGELHNTGVCRTFQRAAALLDSRCGIPGDWKGNHVYFSVPMKAGTNIWRADIAPGALAISAKPFRVTPETANEETEPFASGTGRVAFTRQSYSVDIWGVPVNANEGKATGQPRRWIREPGLNLSPSMTADSALLSFQSNRTGHWGLWLLDTKDGKQSLLASSPQEQLWPLISPDGTKVAYSEERIGGAEQFYRPVGGGQAEPLCRNCAMRVSGWSRDGKTVLLDSFEGEPRRSTVALIELASNRKTVLLEDPKSDLTQASFSPDQRWIVFAARMGDGTARLFAAPFHDGAPSPPKEWIALTDGAAWDTAPQWSPDGRLVYFASTRDGHQCVWARRLDTAGKPSGEPFAVTHFHTLHSSPPMVPVNTMDLFVASGQILVSLGNQTGNIWSVKVSE